jgi:hypothetical protein
VEHEITWGGEPEDVSVETSGSASVEGLHAMAQAIMADPRFRPRLKILIDHSGINLGVLSVQDAQRRVELLADDAGRMGPQHVAIVVGQAASYGVMRMFELLMGDRTRLSVRLFYSQEEAREWLRKPAAFVDSFV